MNVVPAGVFDGWYEKTQPSSFIHQLSRGDITAMTLVPMSPPSAVNNSPQSV